MTTLAQSVVEIGGLDLGPSVQRAIAAGIVVLGGVLLYALGRTVIRRISQQKYPFSEAVRDRAATARSLLLSVWRYAVLIVVVVGLLALLPNTRAALAVGGVAGIIAAVAAQGVLRDVVAGLSILLEGQFTVGDTVRVFGPDVDGVVEAIGLRITILREVEGSRVFIPNGSISAVRVLGPGAVTREGDRRGRGRSRTASEARRPGERPPAQPRAERPAGRPSTAPSEQAQPRAATAGEATAGDGEATPRKRTRRGGRRRSGARRPADGAAGEAAAGEGTVSSTPPSPDVPAETAERPRTPARPAPRTDRAEPAPDEKKDERDLGDSPWSIE